MCLHGNDVEMPFWCDVHRCWELRTIDACIAPLVHRLNQQGVRTTNSCCGHGQYQGTILIDDASYERAVALGYNVNPEQVADNEYLWAVLC